MRSNKEFLLDRLFLMTEYHFFHRNIFSKFDDVKNDEFRRNINNGFCYLYLLTLLCLEHLHIEIQNIFVMFSYLYSEKMF